MRPDIGFEQRSRQPVLDTDFADQRQSRQQFQQAGDMRVVETSGPVGCKGHEMPLAERMVHRPRHIVGQAFRPHLAIGSVLAAQRGIAFEISRTSVAPSWISLAGLSMYSDRSLTS